MDGTTLFSVHWDHSRVSDHRPPRRLAVGETADRAVCVTRIGGASQRRSAGCLACRFAGCQPVVSGRRFALSAQPHSISLSSSKKEERAWERRRFLSISPLSGSLPARSSQGERGKTLKAFYVPNTIGCQPAGRWQGADLEFHSTLRPLAFGDTAGWAVCAKSRFMGRERLRSVPLKNDFDSCHRLFPPRMGPIFNSQLLTHTAGRAASVEKRR